MITSKLPPVAEWPRLSGGAGPYLCLIRNEVNKREHGFLLAGSFELNLGYVFDGGNGRSIMYASEEALLADGWRVD
jgi:hypothetical protein